MNLRHSKRLPQLAARLGVRHLTPRTRELGNPGYRANGPDRCYFCRLDIERSAPVG